MRLMIDRLPVDEILARVASLLPEGTAVLRDDVKKNLKSALGATLSRMDLVTREEFDVQTALLSRTRARLEAMEKRLGALEEALRTEPAPPTRSTPPQT
ncbi:MAG: accessory factor UbiK family protein [Gammaproteobacteria bacterium]